MTSTSDTPNKPVWENRLKEHRLLKGFSQTDLADQVGLSQQTILQIEKGVLSGRKHMDAIASLFLVHPDTIFPYYHYLTYTEAAQLLEVSPTLISKRVEEGVIPVVAFGSVNMVHRDLVTDKILRRARVSIRNQLKSLLAESPSGLSVDTIVGELGPFDGEELAKKKRSIQSILSRGKEFYVNKENKPPTWHASI